MRDGGARRDRTDDLMLAKHPLYQLSYGPIRVEPSGHTLCELVGLIRGLCGMVGLDRLELSTLRLSGVRSNHLSYGPMAARQPGIKAQARDRVTNFRTRMVLASMTE